MPLNMSKNSKTSLKISIVIPTLNCAIILKKCLLSIKKQSYKNYEIIIADGGSTDKTLTLAKKYHCHIIKNSLKTAEAGKAVGVKAAKGEYVALIDSDNILPNKYWLSQMLLPFEDANIIGSEPIAFTYRKNAGFIERYSALLGANDPYAYFSGNYDRHSYLSNKWTNIKIKTEDKQSYLKLKIEDCILLPTIGANGTLFKRDFLLKNIKGDYLFDIDILAQAKKPIYFAKVKNSIIHTFCESSIKKFFKKQNRRLTDYYHYRSLRHYQWTQNSKSISFALYSLLILPALFDSFRGFIKKPDMAWFFHPLACFGTTLIYAHITIKYKLGLLKPLDRNKWQQ